MRKKFYLKCLIAVIAIITVFTTIVPMSITNVNAAGTSATVTEQRRGSSVGDSEADAHQDKMLDENKEGHSNYTSGIGYKVIGYECLECGKTKSA